MDSKVYKCCAVPQCKNTSIRTPNKLFVHVPNKKITRDKWLKLARRNPNDVVMNSPVYFCEDHFDLPNDMENYMEYHMMGSVSQVRTKPGCMPKKLICQSSTKTGISKTTKRPYITKKRRIMVLEECEKQLEEKSLVTEQSSLKREIASGRSVLVTGFGPFISHPVNASWEAVKRINKEELEKRHNIELVLLEIPVACDKIDELVPPLWETHTPKLVIHVGVSMAAKCMTIETLARRQGYQGLKCFEKSHNVCEGETCLHTKLDVERICKEFNDGNPPENTSAISSKDAGRYLCEYIYFTSLSVDNTRTLFIHVPDICTYPSELTAKGLEKILELCLDQINEIDNSK